MVISGGGKGKSGAVLSVMPETQKIIVEGINLKTKFKKPLNGAPGSKTEKEFPIDISNVMIKDTKGKPSRIGYKEVSGKKVRIYKTTGGEIA